jgi:hypothetical protein
MEIEKIRGWFGGNAHKTAPSCVYFRDNASNESRLEIMAVIRFIQKIAKKGMAQLIYVDTTQDDRMVVAYRFTSDRYYDRFHSHILRIAPRLGRGVWSPFSDDHQFHDWFEYKYEEAARAS